MIDDFCFSDQPLTDIYTLSLHDALPIFLGRAARVGIDPVRHADFGFGFLQRILAVELGGTRAPREEDRKSTRLNSSHSQISYAVFCLKKKNTIHTDDTKVTHVITIPYVL